MSEEKKKINIPELLETCPKDEKGRYIVPDDIMEEYYKELPPGTVNESRTQRAANGGKIKILTAADTDIQRAGAEASNATQAQRRTFADTIEYMLKQQADAETKERLRLPERATQQDAIMAAMFVQARKGNVKASTFLRDTIGQQPVSRSEISADIMTDADRELIDRVTARLGNSAQSKAP